MNQNKRTQWTREGKSFGDRLLGKSSLPANLMTKQHQNEINKMLLQKAIQGTVVKFPKYSFQHNSEAHSISTKSMVSSIYKNNQDSVHQKGKKRRVREYSPLDLKKDLTGAQSSKIRYGNSHKRDYDFSEDGKIDKSRRKSEFKAHISRNSVKSSPPSSLEQSKGEISSTKPKITPKDTELSIRSVEYLLTGQSKNFTRTASADDNDTQGLTDEKKIIKDALKMIRRLQNKKDRNVDTASILDHLNLLVYNKFSKLYSNIYKKPDVRVNILETHTSTAFASQESHSNFPDYNVEEKFSTKEIGILTDRISLRDFCGEVTKAKKKKKYHKHKKLKKHPFNQEPKLTYHCNATCIYTDAGHESNSCHSTSVSSYHSIESADKETQEKRTFLCNMPNTPPFLIVMKKSEKAVEGKLTLSAQENDVSSQKSILNPLKPSDSEVSLTATFFEGESRSIRKFWYSHSDVSTIQFEEKKSDFDLNFLKHLMSSPNKTIYEDTLEKMLFPNSRSTVNCGFKSTSFIKCPNLDIYVEKSIEYSCPAFDNLFRTSILTAQQSRTKLEEARCKKRLFSNSNMNGSEIDVPKNNTILQTLETEVFPFQIQQQIVMPASINQKVSSVTSPRINTSASCVPYKSTMSTNTSIKTIVEEDEDAECACESDTSSSSTLSSSSSSSLGPSSTESEDCVCKENVPAPPLVVKGENLDDCICNPPPPPPLPIVDSPLECICPPEPDEEEKLPDTEHPECVCPPEPDEEEEGPEPPEPVTCICPSDELSSEESAEPDESCVCLCRDLAEAEARRRSSSFGGIEGVEVEVEGEGEREEGGEEADAEDEGPIGESEEHICVCRKGETDEFADLIDEDGTQQVWVLSKVTLYADGTKDFDVMEVSPIPPGYYLMPDPNNIILTGFQPKRNKT